MKGFVKFMEPIALPSKQQFYFAMNNDNTNPHNP